jgi:hypothetical protein
MVSRTVEDTLRKKAEEYEKEIAEREPEAPSDVPF